jgi:hypothetical protein
MTGIMSGLLEGLFFDVMNEEGNKASGFTALIARKFVHRQDVAVA